MPVLEDNAFPVLQRVPVQRILSGLGRPIKTGIGLRRRTQYRYRQPEFEGPSRDPSNLCFPP